MAHHPRYQRSLEELFLHVHVYIDDWLRHYRSQLPKYSKQKASVSELLTIAVVGELLAQPFESIWYWLVRETFQELFPSLPEYSRYHFVLRNAELLLAALALSVVGKQPKLCLIDSKPLPVAKGKLADWARLPGASKGFSTMGMVYGFTLHTLTNEQWLFEKWAFASANESDVTLAHELLEGCKDTLVIGEKPISVPPFAPQIVRTCPKGATGSAG